jgi:hypothetical protein
MPKLLLFAPCEKVVIDQTDNTTSIICLLEAIQIAVSESEEASIPPDAIIPINWYLIALWQTEKGDTDKQFETQYSVVFPSGEEKVLNVALPVKFEPGKPNFRNVLKVQGLGLAPLLKADTCTVRARIREHGADMWNVVADFPIIISRPKPETA